MPVNKITKCIICGAIIVMTVALESDALCEECSEKKEKYNLENSFAHEALFKNPYNAQMTTASGAFTSINNN